MKYRRDSEIFYRSVPPSGSGRFLWPIAVVLALAFFGSAVVQGLSSPVLALTYPLFRISRQLENNVSDLRTFLTSQRSLTAETVSLRRENAELNQTLAALKGQIRTYENLLAMVSSSSLETMRPSRVISRPNRSPYDTIIIDGGSKTGGIRSGQLIFSTGGAVLGEIDQVYDRVSRAVLFSSPGRKLNVEIGEQNVQAEAEGMGSGNFKVVLPRGIGVKEGDNIVAPTVSQDILGVVGLVDSRPENPFQTIYFKSPVNLYELAWVLVSR